MLYSIIILLVLSTMFIPGFFSFSLVVCGLYLIFMIPLICIVLFYGFPKLENIFERIKNG